MLSPSEKLRQSVQSAGDAVRDAAKDTGKLVITALVLAAGAFLLAAAALLLALRGRPTA